MRAPHGRTIGILGGVGPVAGFDLATKICQQTQARSDQEHLAVIIYSLPHMIPDRTAVLSQGTPQNLIKPAIRILMTLCDAGASVIGIPCNTMHAPAVFGELEKAVHSTGGRLMNIIKETGYFIRRHLPTVKKPGLLCTLGTYRSRAYEDLLATLGLETIVPCLRTQQEYVQAAICDQSWGIKAGSRPIDPRATERLGTAIGELLAKDIDALILGCTELPLAIDVGAIAGVPVIDATMVLARALVRAAAPRKLRPLSSPFSEVVSQPPPGPVGSLVDERSVPRCPTDY